MGLPSLTVTMLRQAIESHIQANQDMRNIGRVLNNHSDAVGAFNYDKLNRKKRAEMVNYFEKQEIPTTSQDETKTDDEREKRWLKYYSRYNSQNSVFNEKLSVI